MGFRSLCHIIDYSESGNSYKCSSTFTIRSYYPGEFRIMSGGFGNW